jgi:hypothetical protein
MKKLVLIACAVAGLVGSCFANIGPTRKEISLAVREEYDSEGHSSQCGPEGNRLVTGWGFVGLNPETMAKYHLSQGDFVKTEAGWSQIQESASRRGTIEFHADYSGQFQNQRSRLKIVDTRKASEGAPGSTSKTTPTTPTVHYSPHVVINAHGHDASTLKQTILETLIEHSRHLVGL